jgi:hypothetical protein
VPMDSPSHQSECASVESVPLLELPMPIHQLRQKVSPAVDRDVSTFVDVINGDRVHPLEILSAKDEKALGQVTRVLRRNPDVLRALAEAIHSPSLPTYLMEVAHLAVISKTGRRRKLPSVHREKKHSRQ